MPQMPKTAGDELIHTFLGAPQNPTYLGRSLIPLQDAEISAQVDNLFRFPSREMVALKEVIQQFGTSAADLAASQQALLDRISDWKQNAKAFISSFNSASISHESQQFQSTPPPAQAFRSNTALNALSEPHTKSTSDSSEFYLLNGEGRQPGMPESYDSYRSSSAMKSFLKSLSLADNKHDLNQNWRDSAFAAQPLGADMNKPGSICSQSRQPEHLEPLTGATKTPVPAKIGEAYLPNKASKANEAKLLAPTAEQNPLGEVSESALSSLENPEGRAMKFQQQFDLASFIQSQLGYDTQGEIPLTSTSSDASSPYGLLPPAPHSSPVMCATEYLSRTSSDFPTAVEMLREVSKKLELEGLISPAWNQSQSLHNGFDRLKIDDNEPGEWSRTPIRDNASLPEGNITNSFSTARSSTGFARQGFLKGDSDLNNESPISESCQVSTRASSNRPSIRGSIDSGGGSASATWNSIGKETNKKWGLTAFNDAELFVLSFARQVGELGEDSKEAVSLSFELLGLHSEIATASEVEYAGNMVLILVATLAWSANSNENTELVQNKMTDREATESVSIPQYLSRLPKLYKTLAVTKCLKHIELRVTQRIKESIVVKESPTNSNTLVDSLKLLNLVGVDPANLTKNTVQLAAAVADLEVMRYADQLGDADTQTNIREKIFHSTIELLNNC